jgi:hypothetical protein
VEKKVSGGGKKNCRCSFVLPEVGIASETGIALFLARIPGSGIPSEEYSSLGDSSLGFLARVVSAYIPRLEIFLYHR